MIFAARTIIGWYRAGHDPAREMIKLTTYLGHTKPENTYWYIEIALWLGHESVETTQIYIHADLRMKEKALSRVATPETRSGRYRPDDKLLAFLEAL